MCDKQQIPKISITEEETIALKKKMSASENLAKRILLKSRKLVSHEVFELEKRWIYQIEGFKILFPYKCDTYKDTIKTLKILLRYVNFTKYWIS